MDCERSFITCNNTWKLVGMLGNRKTYRQNQQSPNNSFTKQYNATHLLHFTFMTEYGLEIILAAGWKHHQEFIENFVKRLKNFSINFEMKKKVEKKPFREKKN